VFVATPVLIALVTREPAVRSFLVSALPYDPLPPAALRDRGGEAALEAAAATLTERRQRALASANAQQQPRGD